MTQGNYDHPSYIARQMDNLGATTAGANGTSLITTYPMDMRVRRLAAVVLSSSTSGTTGAALYPMILNGTTTTTLGTLTVSTNTANTTLQLADMNTLIPTGAVFFVKNGTDATSKLGVTIELHGDPLTGTWGTP